MDLSNYNSPSISNNSFSCFQTIITEISNVSRKTLKIINKSTTYYKFV